VQYYDNRRIAAFYINDPLGSSIGFIACILAGVTDFFDGHLARAQSTPEKTEPALRLV